MMQNALALAPEAPCSTASAADDDWLTMPEAELEAMQAEALDLSRRRGSAAFVGRTAASLALLHQLVVARGVVRALGLPAAEARAAMRSDHALGYFFGLASGSSEPDAAQRSERQVASTLMMLHDLAYGRQAAEQLTTDLVAGGSMAVGEGFAEGMLAAAADLAALARWRRGDGGALPGGLLDGLGWPRWCGAGTGDRRH
ncbi:hypothetical protein AAFN86_05535 [Roseomonas sp. CAU 1739]|uniref:hypothetical protein n=1 Tax=Roseomonas sp. CAU 1739 TaxID=3140364 RepID=UPI00325AB1BB